MERKQRKAKQGLALEDADSGEDSLYGDGDGDVKQ